MYLFPGYIIQCVIHWHFKSVCTLYDHAYRICGVLLYNRFYVAQSIFTLTNKNIYIFFYSHLCYKSLLCGKWSLCSHLNAGILEWVITVRLLSGLRSRWFTNQTTIKTFYYVIVTRAIKKDEQTDECGKHSTLSKQKCPVDWFNPSIARNRPFCVYQLNVEIHTWTYYGYLWRITSR